MIKTKVMVMIIIISAIAPIAAPKGSTPIVNLNLDVDAEVPNVYKIIVIQHKHQANR